MFPSIVRILPILEKRDRILEMLTSVAKQASHRKSHSMRSPERRAWSLSGN
jgi:hypothetical protein